MAVFSIICYAYFFATGAVGIAVALLVRLVTFPFDPDCLLVHRLTRAWVRHYLKAIPGWNFTFEGTEQFQANQPYILVVNHQSAFDPLLLYMLPNPFKWTAKTWVFKMPVVGWLLRLTNSLEISNKHPLVFLHKCRDVINRGMSVLIFPEGTRSGDGTLLPFKFGAFHLAASEKVPILPVVICGSRFIIPKGNFLKLGLNARVIVKALEPVRPQDFDCNETAMREHVRNLIQNELIELGQTATIGTATVVEQRSRVLD